MCVLGSVNPYQMEGEVSGPLLWARHPQPCDLGRHFMSPSCGFLLSGVRGPLGLSAGFTRLK